MRKFRRNRGWARGKLMNIVNEIYVIHRKSEA